MGEPMTPAEAIQVLRAARDQLAEIDGRKLGSFSMLLAALPIGADALEEVTRLRDRQHLLEVEVNDLQHRLATSDNRHAKAERLERMIAENTMRRLYETRTEVERLREIDAAARAYRRAMFAPGQLAETTVATRQALWASLGPDDALDQTALRQDHKGGVGGANPVREARILG